MAMLNNQMVPFITIIVDGNYWTWQFLMGKSTMSMAMFNSYVKLAELLP